MIRICKDTHKILKIAIGNSDVSSIFVIPGVTNYTNVFTYGNALCLSNEKVEESAHIIFASESDLERFAVIFAKDMKNISSPINVSVEQKLSIFDNIKNYIDMKFGWIKKAYNSSVKVSSSGDVYIRSKDVFEGQKDDAIKTLEKISKLTVFKLEDAKRRT